MKVLSSTFKHILSRFGFILFLFYFAKFLKVALNLLENFAFYKQKTCRSFLNFLMNPFIYLLFLHKLTQKLHKISISLCYSWRSFKNISFYRVITNIILLCNMLLIPQWSPSSNLDWKTLDWTCSLYSWSSRQNCQVFL